MAKIKFLDDTDKEKKLDFIAKDARIRVRVSDTIRIGYTDVLFQEKHQYADTDTNFLIEIKTYSNLQSYK